MLKFWSGLSLFFQIALVVAAVVLFSYFDPFGLLTPRKQTLVDTPVSVRSIREIGKLITAEYYGEVLTSLQEALIDEVSEKAIDIEAELRLLETLFQEAIRDLRDRQGSINYGWLGRAKKLTDFFYQEYPTLTQNPYFQRYLKLIMDKSKGGRKERSFLKKLVEKDTDIEAEFKDMALKEVDFDQFKKQETELLTADKKFHKSQIVVLGRGWVKAGIDFETFTDSNFKYDVEKKTIHLIGLHPEILVCDINPWFIPEKKVKGFEVVLMTKKANSPEYMNKVKTYTLERLRQNAQIAGILVNAKENAEANLKNFFSLLIPEGIDEVVMHDDFFSYFDASLLTGSLNALTMESVDSLFQARYPSDSVEVMTMLDTLKGKVIYIDQNAYPVQRYSNRLQFLDDHTLTAGESSWLETERSFLMGELRYLDTVHHYTNSVYASVSRLDSVWFFPAESLVDKYREQVNAHYNETFPWYQVISGHEKYVAYQNQKRGAVAQKVHLYMMQQRLGAFQQLIVILKNNITQYVKDKVTYVLEDTTSDVKSEDRKLEDREIKYVSSLSGQLNFIEGGIRDWLKQVEPQMVDLQELYQLDSVLEAGFFQDQEAVLVLRELVRECWSIVLDLDTIEVDRYSTWYSFVADGILDSSETEKVLTEWGRVLRNEPLMQSSKKEGLHLTLLDSVWFFPPPEMLETFKKEAEKVDFNLWFWQKKERDKKERFFVEQKVQYFLAMKKKVAFMNTMKVILSHISSLHEASGKGYDFSAGIPSDLPTEWAILLKGSENNVDLMIP